jgi:hypothetical protein
MARAVLGFDAERYAFVPAISFRKIGDAIFIVQVHMLVMSH